MDRWCFGCYVQLPMTDPAGAGRKMLTGVYGIHVTIYSGTMDPMGIQLAYFEMIQIDTYFSALKSAMGSMF